MTTPTSSHATAAARRALPSLALATMLALPGFAPPAAASAPVERVNCTAEPRSRWMPEETVRRLFGVEKYALVKMKISRTNCYEFYAVGREGGVVESYYHPVTGRLVKETRVGMEQIPAR